MQLFLKIVVRNLQQHWDPTIPLQALESTSSSTLHNGNNRTLDYILAGTQLLKLMKHCRVYNKPTKNWKQAIGTDNKIVISDIRIPSNRKS